MITSVEFYGEQFRTRCYCLKGVMLPYGHFRLYTSPQNFNSMSTEIVLYLNYHLTIIGDDPD